MPDPFAPPVDLPLTDPDLGFTWRPLAVFEGSLDGWRGGKAAGETLIVLSVPQDWKYEAMPLTDAQGKRFRVRVEVAEFEMEDT